MIHPTPKELLSLSGRQVLELARIKTSAYSDYRPRGTLYEKTSAEQPLYRHRSTLLIRDPETGKLLAAKETDPNSKTSPFYFPGGGLYEDEYDTPRNPSEEDIIAGARREALEELGIELDNPRVVGSFGAEMEDWWKEKTLKNKGVPYLGGHEHYVLADKGKADRSLYNVEGDAFEQGDYYDPKEIVVALSRAAKSDSPFARWNKEQVRAIKDNLLKKNASDLSVLTAVPKSKSAVIIKGNPYYVEQGPDVDNYSNYYREIEEELRKAGYDDISYDRGDDYTTPKDADLWVGHSRGRGRLRLAPENTKTLALDDYEDGAEEYSLLVRKAMRELGYGSLQDFPVEKRPRPGKGHYTVTDRMREALSKTSSAKEQLRHILVKQASLEAEFKPDLSPDDLRALGVYDQVYGDAPSEASMKEWPAHWINPQDPLGWLQWYDRYSGGRRTDDDERQIKRWKSFKARHLAQYLSKPTPRRAAALRNWGIDVEKLNDK